MFHIFPFRIDRTCGLVIDFRFFFLLFLVSHFRAKKHDETVDVNTFIRVYYGICCVDDRL